LVSTMPMLHVVILLRASSWSLGIPRTPSTGFSGKFGDPCYFLFYLWYICFVKGPFITLYRFGLVWLYL
jgi:hypothetical protein